MADIKFDNLVGGLNYRDTLINMGKSPVVYWVLSSNVKPFQNTGIQKCRGNTLVVDHGTKIIAAGNYNLGNLEYIMFADSAGSVYEYDTGGSAKSAALVTGLSSSARGAWVVHGQGIIYSNGVNEPFIYFRARSTAVTGTASVTNGSSTVTGAGTTFESQLAIGDQIVINSETHIIDSITNDTELVTRANFAATTSGKPVTRSKITWLIATGADGSTLRSTAIASYKGRVYMGYNGGLYWTALGTYTDWTTADDAGYNKNFFSDSSTIQALSVFGDSLAIHRKEQVVLMQDTEGSPDYFVFDVKANRGSESQFGIITVQNEHIFYDAGIWPLSGAGALDQILLQSEVSTLINNDRNGFLNGELDESRVDEITILHNRNKKEIWCYFPIDSVTYFQQVYVYCYDLRMWYRRVSPQNITCAIEHNNTIYSFDSGGKVYQEDTGVDWSETALDFYIQTAYINFGEEYKEKDIDEIQIIVDSVIENSFNYKYLFDYNSYNSSGTQSFSLTSDADALVWAIDDGSNTSTVWADGSSGNEWAELVLNNGYLDHYNGMKGISFYLEGDSGTQDLGLMGINFKGVAINSR